MTDQETPDNPTKPECAVTIALAPDGGGIAIQVHGGDDVRRPATMPDLESIAGQLQAFLMAQRMAHTVAATAPKVVTPRNGFRFGRS